MSASGVCTLEKDKRGGSGRVFHNSTGTGEKRMTRRISGGKRAPEAQPSDSKETLLTVTYQGRALYVY